jgi:glutaredoxin
MKPLSVVSVVLSGLLVCSTPIQAGSVQAHMQTGPAEVLMFTLPGCSYCKSAKELMSKKRIPFREIDLTTDEGMKLAETMKVPPMAPVFAYKDRVMQGYTEDRLLKFIEN